MPEPTFYEINFDRSHDDAMGVLAYAEQFTECLQFPDGNAVSMSYITNARLAATNSLLLSEKAKDKQSQMFRNLIRTLIVEYRAICLERPWEQWTQSFSCLT